MSNLKFEKQVQDLLEKNNNTLELLEKINNYLTLENNALKEKVTELERSENKLENKSLADNEVSPAMKELLEQRKRDADLKSKTK